MTIDRAINRFDCAPCPSRQISTYKPPAVFNPVLAELFHRRDPNATCECGRPVEVKGQCMRCYQRDYMRQKRAK